MTAVPLQRMTAKGRRVPRMQSPLGAISSASKIDQLKTAGRPTKTEHFHRNPDGGTWHWQVGGLHHHHTRSTVFSVRHRQWSEKRRRSASNAVYSVFVGRTAKRCRKLDVTDAVQSGRCIPKICTARCPHQASLLQSRQRSMCLSHLEMPDRTTVFECMCRNTSSSLRGRKIDRERQASD